MTKEIIYLVEHHAKRFIPELAKEGSVEELGIFFRLGVVSNDYPFLWDRGGTSQFTVRINEAIEAYNAGKIKVIPEGEKKRDHICQKCGNFVGRRCRLERNNTFCVL